MKVPGLELQVKACEYMEKTYGKDWDKRNINQPAITNAYIQGYRDKEDVDKTAEKLLLSRKKHAEFRKLIESISEKTVDKMGDDVGKFFAIDIVINDKMPDHLGAFVDGEGNVLSFIEFEKK